MRSARCICEAGRYNARRRNAALPIPPSTPMKDWELTEESFNLFLSWLSEDRDTAGKKYEDIRRRLIIVLEARRCLHPGEVADEAINRFIRRLPELIETFEGEPLPYILVIARNIQHESDRKQTTSLPDNIDTLLTTTGETDEPTDCIHECLDECLGKLDLDSRNLLLDYYQNDKQEKIHFRKTLAKQLGIAANALRLRMHRLRRIVHECMDNCLQIDSVGNETEPKPL